MTAKKTRNHSRRYYIIRGVLLFILIAGLGFWTYYKYHLAGNKIDSLVNEKSKGLYQLQYDHLNFDEVLGNLSVENVTMLPDSMIYQSMKEQKTAPENLFYINIKKIQITGVKTPKALLNKEINAHIVFIDHADIELRMGKSDEKQKPDIKSIINGDLYNQILGKLKSIQADSIVLNESTLIISDRLSKKVRGKISGLSLRFAGVRIDSASANDSTRILFSNEIAIHGQNIDLPLNKIYDLSIHGLDYNSSNRELRTNEIRLRPKLSEDDFARSFSVAKDRFDIRIQQVYLKGIDRRAMLNERLIAEELKFNDAAIHVFRDKSVPHDSVDRTHDFPQEAIMRLPFPIYVKTIAFDHSYIEYKEKNDKSDSSGKVAFFNVQATVGNVTNIPTYIRENNQIHVNFNSSFLNQAAFTADIHLRLNDHAGHFEMDATLASMNAQSLNPLLKPMALAEIKSGNISGLRYHLNATNTSAKGSLNFTYENLSIKLLKKDDDKNKYKTKLLPTLAAGLLLKESNPRNGKFRKGSVEYKRDIYRSIFNLMWKSLFTAIKDVAM